MHARADQPDREFLTSQNTLAREFHQLIPSSTVVTSRLDSECGCICLSIFSGYSKRYLDFLE